MQQEAEANAETDKQRKALIEARNHLDSLVYTAEKTLKDAGDKASAEDKSALEEAIKAAKAQLESDDIDLLTKEGSKLSEAMQKVGAAMYANAPGTEGAPEEVEAHEEEGKPVEGEVVDEDENENKEK
jgi:molecular chaperone DnaK